MTLLDSARTASSLCNQTCRFSFGRHGGGGYMPNGCAFAYTACRFAYFREYINVIRHFDDDYVCAECFKLFFFSYSAFIYDFISRRFKHRDHTLDFAAGRCRLNYFHIR